MADADRGRVPPGQYVTPDFPVLHYGAVPRVDLRSWTFRLFGLVEEEVCLTYDQLLALPQRDVTCDIHCVTGWTKLGTTWRGVPTREVVRLVRLRPETRFVLVHAEQGFTANLPLEDFLAEDALLAYRYNGQDLTPEHGWPLRLVVPHLYFWKSAKWVRGVEFLADDRPGFWESNGYHMRGDPWKEQRYLWDP